jgi:succinate-semialdehyde dehydrogenase / glutarate-semialdehyde dehydrogenase
MLDKITLRNPTLMQSANLIGGQWTVGSGTIPVTNPATGILLGTVPNGGRADAKRAIEAAAHTFPAWRAKTAAERADVLRRLHALIRDNQEDLALLLTSEQGKPLAEARGEVGMSAACMCSGSPRKRGASTAT